VEADIPALKGTTHLFLACLTWADPASDPGFGWYFGPVGLQVLAGQLLMGDVEFLSTRESTIFQPEASRRLQAGEPPPILLMFGAIPQDAPIWNPETAACAGSCMPTTLARL
jgi:hypothetical protein